VSSLAAFVATVSLAAFAPQQRPLGKAPPMPADVEPVVTTESGLKYSVLVKGQEGASPKLGDKAKVHYTGWNTDGSVFDSTRVNGKPGDFLVGDGIDGWIEALMLMTPGAHWRLTIPPQLAYGERGNLPRIAPHATLIFEIELLSFEKGIDLPRFHPGDPAKQTRTESGLVYEPLVDVNGAKPKPDDVLELKFAVWNTKGRLIDCSEKRDNFTFNGRVQDLPLRLLQDAARLMTVGSRYRFEAPAELCEGFRVFGAAFLPAGSVTVWELELKSAREVKLPAFVKPDPAQQKSTPSGLKYEVLKEGTGAQLKMGDVFTVAYAGWLTDGTLVDSSLLRDGTMRRQLQPRGLIQGWTEGLQLMKEGSTFRFEIPGNLAYAQKGSPPKIPPNATLIYEIELVNVGK